MVTAAKFTTYALQPIGSDPAGIRLQERCDDLEHRNRATRGVEHGRTHAMGVQMFREPGPTLLVRHAWIGKDRRRIPWHLLKRDRLCPREMPAICGRQRGIAKFCAFLCRELQPDFALTKLGQCRDCRGYTCRHTPIRS